MQTPEVELLSCDPKDATIGGCGVNDHAKGAVGTLHDGSHAIQIDARLAHRDGLSAFRIESKILDLTSGQKTDGQCSI